MSHKKIKERKKKAKERKTQAQLQYKRKVRAKDKKRERIIDADVRANRERIDPIVNPETIRLRKQKELERNIQILKALEEQYQKDKQFKRELNERLEAQGAKTLQEKIDIVGKEAEGSLLEKTNKVLSKVRGKEILQGLMEKTEWQERRKIFRENLTKVLKTSHDNNIVEE
jgi:hypothetical protein